VGNIIQIEGRLTKKIIVQNGYMDPNKSKDTKTFELKIGMDAIPARLDAEQVATLLGFSAGDIPVLVSNRLLRPLGKPMPNARKYFSWHSVVERAHDETWLVKATQKVYDHWAGKNARKRQAEVETLSMIPRRQNETQ
jgi:hypothetical protein